jgi:hypothetical protein
LRCHVCANMATTREQNAMWSIESKLHRHLR